MSWQFEAYAFVGIAAPVSSCDRRRGRRCGVVTEDRIAVDASAQADDPDQARAEPVSFSGERHRRLRCSLRVLLGLHRVLVTGGNADALAR